ncbi:MAG: ABC transporter substrate-binding protein [Propionivibrio sp.]
MKSLFLMLFGFCVGCLPALAQDNSPDTLIKSVTDDVLTIVRQDQDIKSGNTQKAIDLVEAKVLPHFDFQRMTALAVGRDWNKATPEQKQQLAEEFKTLLVRTYSNALTEYKNQTVRYEPTRMQAGDTDVVVRSKVLQPGGQPIQLDYSVEKKADGWKVYDVIVAGVSLVTNYRATFNREVSANGVDGLLKMLADKNQQLAASQQ